MQATFVSSCPTSTHSFRSHKPSARDNVKHIESFFFAALEKYSARRQTIQLGRDLRANTHLQHFRADFGGVTSLQYIENGDRVAVGFCSGHLKVFNPQPTSLLRASYTSETVCNGWEGNYDVSCLRNHPSKPTLLYMASTAGTVGQYNLSIDHIDVQVIITEDKNEIFSFDVNEKGDTLATGGKDATVRVYDVNTRKMVQRFGKQRPSSHSLVESDAMSIHHKRIYCVKRHPTEPCIFASGGWDRTVKLWDVRVGRHCVRNIIGPYIFGEAVDMHKRTLLTASCQKNGDVEIWDLGSGQLMNTASLSLKEQVPFTAQFFKGDPTGDLVLVGGRGPGLQVISLNQSSTMYLFEEENPIIAIDSTEDKIAFGGKSHSIAFSTVCLHEPVFSAERMVSASSVSTGGNSEN